MKSVGIDIGSFSLKVAEINVGTKGFALNRFQEFPLSQDPNKDRKIELVDLLRNLATQYDPNNTRFVLCVRQSQVSLRLKSFPFKERHKILKSLAFELEDDIPFSPQDSIFDAKIISYTGNSAQLLAVASPKDHIKDILYLAHDCGIDLEILSVEGLAFANLFEDWAQPAPLKDPEEVQPPEPPAAEIILDIGHSSTNLLLYSKGLLLGIRSLDWGGKNVAEEIATAYSMHYLEALKELQRKAYILINPDGASKDQVTFSEVIKKSVDSLTHDLKLHLIDLETEFKVKVDRGVMMGGACQIKNLGPYLTQKLNFALNRLKHLKNYPEVDFEASPHNEVVSGVAIGLALEGIKKPRNPAINLLKDEFAKQSQALRLFWDRWSHTLQVGAGAFVVLLVFGIIKDNLANRMAEEAYTAMRQTAAQVANLTGRQATGRNVRRFLADQAQIERNRAVAERVLNINSAMDVLKAVTSLTPGQRQLEIDVRGFKINNDLVEIQGELQRGNLADFQQALQNLSVNGQVETFSPQLPRTPGKQNFGFRFRVQRMRGS